VRLVVSFTGQKLKSRASGIVSLTVVGPSILNIFLRNGRFAKRV
jgi:hypothetical protein